MTDVVASLSTDRPRRRVHIDTAVGHLRRPIHLEAITPGRVGGNAVRGRIHDEVSVPVADGVDPVVGRRAVLTHRDRHGLDHLAVAPDRQCLGVVVGGSDHPIADAEAGVAIPLPVEALTEIRAVGVDGHIHHGARLPEVPWPPSHLAIAQPVERTLHWRLSGHGDGLLGGDPVGNVLVKLHRDRLAYADNISVVGHQIRHRETGR